MLQIQRLLINEVKRLRTLRLAALKDAPDAFGSTFQDVATYSEATWRSQLQSLPTFVAVLDSMDSGIVRGAPHSEQTTVAYLLSMWVAPHARGQGIGEALTDSVIDWAHTAGYKQLVLDVSESNHFAISLYTRKGFKPTGVIGHLPPPREHILEWEMALDL